jgi:hypothetical protein
MLAGRCRAVLPEWLCAVAKLGRHVPSELVPVLLDVARVDDSLRSLVMAAGGQRAQWLAGHNPEWAFGVTDSSASWETGSRDQRLAILRDLRVADPAEARGRIEDAWKTEPADVRVEFLSALEHGLSDSDAPFLESALDDRSKEVRRRASDLLARFPTSAFVGRMRVRAQPLFSWKRGGLLSRASIEVRLPEESDSAAIRDGLDPKIFGAQKVLGEKAAVLVLIISAMPLSHWEEAFQATPEAILKAVEKNEFARALVTGWTWAALRQRDEKWSEALLDFPIAPHHEFLPKENLLSILPPAVQANRLVTALRADGLKNRDSAAWHSLGALLTGFPGEWPSSLARAVLAALRSAAGDGIPWHLRPVAESLAIRIPADMLVEAAADWPLDKEGISNLVELLTFRHDALSALTQT